MVNVSDGAALLRPQRVADVASDLVAAATTEGKLLLFAIAELPQLARGKGVQTIKIHNTPIAPEKVVSVAVVPRDGTLVVHAGKRITMQQVMLWLARSRRRARLDADVMLQPLTLGALRRMLYEAACQFGYASRH